MKLQRIPKDMESMTFTLRLPVNTVALIRARAVELNMTQGCLVDLAVKYQANLGKKKGISQRDREENAEKD